MNLPSPARTAAGRIVAAVIGVVIGFTVRFTIETSSKSIGTTATLQPEPSSEQTQTASMPENSTWGNVEQLADLFTRVQGLELADAAKTLQELSDPYLRRSIWCDVIWSTSNQSPKKSLEILGLYCPQSDAEAVGRLLAQVFNKLPLEQRFSKIQELLDDPPPYQNSFVNAVVGDLIAEPESRRRLLKWVQESDLSPAGSMYIAAALANPNFELSFLPRFLGDDVVKRSPRKSADLEAILKRRIGDPLYVKQVLETDIAGLTPDEIYETAVARNLYFGNPDRPVEQVLDSIQQITAVQSQEKFGRRVGANLKSPPDILALSKYDTPIREGVIRGYVESHWSQSPHQVLDFLSDETLAPQSSTLIDQALTAMKSRSLHGEYTNSTSDLAKLLSSLDDSQRPLVLSSIARIYGLDHAATVEQRLAP